MGQDRPINALLPGFAQVHVFNSTRIKPFIPVYMPIAMYLGVFAHNTPRSRVSACFHLPSTASTALHVLSKCQTRVWRHLGEQLNVPAPDLASLRAMYRRGKTLFEHQQLACEALGFRWLRHCK